MRRKEVYQVYGFKHTSKQESKVTSNEECESGAQPSLSGPGRGPGGEPFPVTGANGKLVLSLHHHQQQPVYYSLQQPSDLLTKHTGTAGAVGGRGRDFI